MQQVVNQKGGEKRVFWGSFGREDGQTNLQEKVKMAKRTYKTRKFVAITSIARKPKFHNSKKITYFIKNQLPLVHLTILWPKAYGFLFQKKKKKKKKKKNSKPLSNMFVFSDEFILSNTM
jgi:hypothetical protein